MRFDDPLLVGLLLVARHDHVAKFGGCAVYLDCLIERGVVLGSIISVGVVRKDV